MSLSYYDDNRKRRTGLATGWMVLNALIALCMAFYWSGVAVVLGEPFHWAMRESVSPHPNFFEYPYLTLWSTPILCMLAGWLALKARQHTIATIVGGYPTVMLVLMLGWYYGTPPEWH
jgi:hypothetical protein